MILLVVRILIIVILLAVVSALSSIVFLLRPFHPNNVFLVSRILNVAYPILGLKLNVTGREHIYKHRPCVAISNHQTSLDVFLGTALVPPHMVSMGKKSLRLIPIFGQMYWLSGNVLIDRGNKRKAMDLMDKVAEEMHERDLSLWIMPEGTRSYGRGILPFKRGAFYLAKKANVPLVPVIISDYANLNFRKWKSGTINVSILPPARAPEDIYAWKDQMEEVFKNEFDRISNKDHFHTV